MLASLSKLEAPGVKQCNLLITLFARVAEGCGVVMVENFSKPSCRVKKRSDAFISF